MNRSAVCCELCLPARSSRHEKSPPCRSPRGVLASKTFRPFSRCASNVYHAIPKLERAHQNSCQRLSEEAQLDMSLLRCRDRDLSLTRPNGAHTLHISRTKNRAKPSSPRRERPHQPSPLGVMEQAQLQHPSSPSLTHLMLCIAVYTVAHLSTVLALQFTLISPFVFTSISRHLPLKKI